MIVDIRLMVLPNKLKILSSNLIMHSMKIKPVKSFISTRFVPSWTMYSIKESLPSLHTDKLAQGKHSQWMEFKVLLSKICSKEVSIIGKIINETSQWQFLCMKYMEEKYMIYWMITHNWPYVKTKITWFKLLD